MRAIDAGRDPVMCLPLKTMSPRVGVRKCVSDQCVDRPALDLEVDAVDRDEALELLGQAAGLEDRVGGHGGWALRRSDAGAPASVRSSSARIRRRVGLKETCESG